MNGTRVARRGMVCAADQLAAVAGIDMLAAGGTAADAVVAAAAVMATTSPHLCGMGGDLLAMVHDPGRGPAALLGVGRAGSGADADRMVAEGLTVMPLRLDVRSATVPGAVDGWLALHARHGRLPVDQVVGPAISLAEEGFAASPLLAAASHLVADVPGAQELCPDGPLRAGQRVRLPGIARTLRLVAAEGRDAFYLGQAGQALRSLGQGLFTEADLAAAQATWHEPLRLRAWGHDLWTVPPPSQGYLTLAGAAVAQRVGLPEDVTDPRWPHLMVEAVRAVGHDRPACLHEAADGPALLSEQRLDRAVGRVSEGRAAPPDVAGERATDAPRRVAEGSALPPRLGDGDATHLCAVDQWGLGISLTQSNALDFGLHRVLGATGIFLHDRGLGFSLQPGHPARLGPAKRPPHTLSPALVTRPDGSLAQLVGTMGGDGQPAIILQLLARTLHGDQDPGAAIAAARLVLDAPSAGPFRLWWGHDLLVRLEEHAPASWAPSLRRRGHRVEPVPALDPVTVGQAQLIAVDPPEDADPGTSPEGAAPPGPLRGASDPRSLVGGAVGR